MPSHGNQFEIMIERAHSTIVEMLKYRGYVDIASSPEFKSLLTSNFATVYFQSPHDDKAVIYHIGQSSSSSTTNAALLKTIMACTASHIIVAAYGAKPLRGETKIEDKNVEYWTIEELQYNPSKHMLVPHHKISDVPHKQLLEENQITSLHQLPWILTTDVMARFINAHDGDVVEITRFTPTSGHSKIYRYCKRV